MFVIIAGAGEVGSHAAEVLSNAGHNVTVIDLNPDRLRDLSENLDLRTLAGHCAHFDVLHEAGAEKCDLLVAATQVDEVNMLTASLAKAAGTAKTIVRVHHTANFALRGTRYARQLGIDELICPEHLTSLAIARAVRNPGLIAIEEFGSGKLMMQRLAVSRGATAVGRRLAELSLPERTRVVTVEHEHTVVIANAATPINEGDYVTLIGDREAFDSARKLFQKGKETRIHIAIMGETATAVWLGRAFRNRIFSVRLFVEHHGRAEELSTKLSRVTVLEADPTDPAVFTDERIERTDAFIAATDDDERNILACAQAKRLGVPTVISVVQRSTYLHLLPHVGIDHAFSPRSDAVKAIQNLIDDGPIRSVATFADDIAEVYELRLSKRAKVIGEDLRNVKMPPQSMIAAIARGDEVYVPRAQDRLAADDTILVIGRRGLAEELLKLFVES